jgi:hypothetical protein
MSNSFWTTNVPIWVSRKTSDGLISQYAVSGWMFMLGWSLICLNILLWSIIGLVTAALTVVHAF